MDSATRLFNASVSRRHFVGGLVASIAFFDRCGNMALASETVEKKGESARSARPGALSKPLIKPRALRRGDTIGIVAPSSPLFDEGEIEFTFKWLEKVGLKYKLGKHIFESYSDYAGTDEARIEDLHAMWADADVAAVMPMRGGNGAVRLLPRLDFDLIGRNPKIIMGYSDITALLVPIHERTGLVTFHGPMMGSFFEGPYTFRYFHKAVMNKRPIGLITDLPAETWNPSYPPPRMVLSEGSAEGRLTGGCMTLIRQLMGTPYEMETEGRILFMEDLESEPHEIDRYLTQLLLAGKLQKAAGIVIGECSNCHPGDSKRNSLPLNYSLERVLKDRLSGLSIPVVYGFRFGHSKEKFTLPLGVMASLNASRKGGVQFKIEEAATV